MEATTFNQSFKDAEFTLWEKLGAVVRLSYGLDEVVKLSPHACAIRDVEDEELRSFFYEMSPWQFILIVTASSVGEELFYRAAVQSIILEHQIPPWKINKEIKVPRKSAKVRTWTEQGYPDQDTSTKGVLADVFLRSTELVGDVRGIVSLTGVLPPFVPFAQAFAAVITAALTGSLYYVAASPKDRLHLLYNLALVVRIFESFLQRGTREDS